MRAAIAEAEVGDDVLDGDPTTRRLESDVARLLGHEAALFFPTGTQANQVAVRLLSEQGTEIIVEEWAHLTDYEEAASAALWGVQLRTVRAPDGVMTPELVQERIRQGRYYPRTAAIVVENTHNAAGGKVTGIETMAALRQLADAHDLPLHVDGARLWNAAEALGCPPETLAALVGAGRQEHDRQEPTRPDAHDGDIVGIDQDCVSTHIASGQGDGVRGSDQRTFGNVDRAGVLTERGPQAHFAR